MKSKYFLTLFLVAILPVCVLAGVYFFMASMEKPVAIAPPVDNAAVGASISALSTDLGTQASSLQNNITSAYKTLPGLVANHGDADLERFFKTTNGLECVEIYTYDGKKLKTVPANVQLADTTYGSSEEFKKIVTKFQENPGREDLFYTTRFNFPAFVFSVSLDGKTMVQAIMNLSRFFPNTDPYNGEMIFLDGESGQIFYDSITSKNQTAFNPTQDPWLDKIQKSLQAKQSGRDTNPPSMAAVWTSLGIKSFGLIHTVPFSALQPKNTAAPKSQGSEGFERVFQSDTGRIVGLAAIGLVGFSLLLGIILSSVIFSSLKKATATVLRAAQGQGELTPQMVQSFGKDDVGQMVQAAASLMQKLQDDRQAANQEKEDAIRKARSEADAKAREAAAQVSNAQQAASSARSDANEKNQQLNDKLKELDALKSMSEGLRNQTEQAKAEIGKLKGQISTAEQAKADTQLQLTQTQYKLEGQLKEMEAKLLSAVAASSAIQVSQVRAAAIRTMSEELKTTLGIIKGYVSSALGTAQGGINEKQQEFLGMVINRSARLEKFINDLLDIYQVEIEQAGAAHEEVNLAAEIEGLAFNFQTQADVKNIKLKVEPKGTLPKVPIVRRRFNQLWNILYLQIIKDAPRGSSITIGVEPLGENVKVTVQDPGLNVATESLPKMFDEFYDPKHPASPQLAGTGLKFALVKTILAAHGGGAVAEKADPGTQLILTFPTQIKKPGETPKPISAIPASPSLSAPGAKMPPTTAARPATAAPAVPGVPGAAKPAPPAVPGAKPAAPGVPGMAAAVRPPAPGASVSPTAAPGTPAAPGVAKSPAAGFLDSLISKSQPVNVTPGAAKPAIPGTPVPGMPTAPKPSVPGAPAAPGVLGAVRPPVPGAPIPAAPGMPAAPKPPVPGVPAAPGAPAVPKPPMPAGAGSLDSLLKAPSPAVPGIPAVAKPPMPGAPPVAPGIKPPIPAGAPPAPAAPGAPKVVPTTLKPTAPPPGILDMDNVDGVKTSAPPKPAAPPMPPKPVMPGAPGAPMPPGAAPKPPAPGIPPGGLDASKAQKPKDDGDLID